MLFLSKAVNFVHTRFERGMQNLRRILKQKHDNAPNHCCHQRIRRIAHALGYFVFKITTLPQSHQDSGSQIQDNLVVDRRITTPYKISANKSSNGRVVRFFGMPGLFQQQPCFTRKGPIDCWRNIEKSICEQAIKNHNSALVSNLGLPSIDKNLPRVRNNPFLC